MSRVGKYFKKKREEAGLSLREAAELVGGITHQHIMEIERGSTSPTFNKVMRLLKAYNSDMQEFLRETGYLPTNVEPAEMLARKIPVISWVQAGQWAEVDVSFGPRDAENWIDTDVQGEHVFALVVKGNSMEPEFIEGDTIIVRPQAKVNNGEFVIVRNHNNEATLKQIKKIGKRRILHPLNKKYTDIELSGDQEYVVVGKVVEKVKRKRY